MYSMYSHSKQISFHYTIQPQFQNTEKEIVNVKEVQIFSEVESGLRFNCKVCTYIANKSLFEIKAAQDLHTGLKDNISISKKRTIVHEK